jgi:HlyD family secretion protein
VVTYTAVIDVANPDQKLKPGMTANITATVEQRENVLTIPAAALRFQPATASEEQPAGQANLRARRAGGPTVWRVEGAGLQPVPVRLGLSNGVVTEVVSGDLKEGDAIAVPNVNNSRQGGPQASPFGARPRGVRR